MSLAAMLEGVSLRLGIVQALDRIDLAVEPGQFMALLGPSGSGKTTTLNLLAGFRRPDRGRIIFDGSDVTEVPAFRRDLGVVFQGYALFPHMSVRENVEFPLRMRRMSRTERMRKARDALALVGLSELAERSVGTLSGGQQQRVALARAIVFEPRMMLLDEPLAALDKQLRDQMQHELRSLQRRIGITTVAVTHDQVEALTMADLVAVLHAGHIEQIATPQELYLRPATLFVARFLGEANLIDVVDGRLLGFGPVGKAADGCAVVRPEHLTLVGDQASDSLVCADGVVAEVAFQGARVRARVTLAEGERDLTLALSSLIEGNRVQVGDKVRLGVDPATVHVIPEADISSADSGAGDDPGQAVRGLEPAVSRRG